MFHWVLLPSLRCIGGRTSESDHLSYESDGSHGFCQSHASCSFSTGLLAHTHSFLHSSWHLSISAVYFPAWLIVSLIWHYRIFSLTNPGLIVLVHILLGLNLVSWSFFVATPFGKSPQLAAIVSTFLSILVAILGVVLRHIGTGLAFVLSIIFPPSFYVFAIRAITGFENHLQPADAVKQDPDNHLILLPFVLAAAVSHVSITLTALLTFPSYVQVNVFLWPWLALLLERRLYDAFNPSKKSWIVGKQCTDRTASIPNHVAISVQNLGKVFRPSIFGGGKPLTAISDLSFDVPKAGIFVLLGSNGYVFHYIRTLSC
jgi:ATP-binding cassette subfamily A (ABC1) protein 3